MPSSAALMRESRYVSSSTDTVMFFTATRFHIHTPSVKKRSISSTNIRVSRKCWGSAGILHPSAFRGQVRAKLDVLASYVERLAEEARKA